MHIRRRNSRLGRSWLTTRARCVFFRALPLPPHRRPAARERVVASQHLAAPCCVAKYFSNGCHVRVAVLLERAGGSVGQRLAHRLARFSLSKNTNTHSPTWVRVTMCRSVRLCVVHSIASLPCCRIRNAAHMAHACKALLFGRTRQSGECVCMIHSCTSTHVWAEPSRVLFAQHLHSRRMDVHAHAHCCRLLSLASLSHTHLQDRADLLGIGESVYVQVSLWTVMASQHMT
jgi:hypothetical protein